MPTVRILQWNIEKFGIGSVYNDANSRGLIFNFIRRLKDFYQIDVILIQEMRSNATWYLNDLRTELNNPPAENWQFDYLPSAISSASALTPAAGITFADLAYTGDANLEGYAVFAKAGLLNNMPRNHSFQSTAFGTGAGTGKINVVLDAIQPVLDNLAVPPIAPAAPVAGMRPTGQAQFPLPSSPWIPSPDAARYRARGAKRRPLAPPQVLYWERCRRPCHVRVNVGAGAGARTVDVVTYHAPVEKRGPLYGTLACSLSSVIWTSQNCAVGGDFNLNQIAQRNVAFQTVTAPVPAGPPAQATGYTAGTHRAPGPNIYVTTGDNYQRTSVHYDNNNHTAFRPVGDDCLGAARDFVFTKYVPAAMPVPVPALPVTGVPDLLTDMQDAAFQTVYRHPATQNVMAAKLANAVLTNRAITPAYEDSAWTRTFRDSFNAAHVGGFPDRLSAAFFYRKFITDHLPVVITVTV